MEDIFLGRRELSAALLALPTLASFGKHARADKINPDWTIVRHPDEIKWEFRPDYPANSVESAPLFGSINEPGLYYVLIRWHPGYMSAPHTYVTDRLSLVLSGTWWVNSGADFDPDRTVPVNAGGFVRRVAHTPHYDGVKRDAKEPAIIALFGIAPVDLALVDPSKPGWRRI